MDGEGEEAGQAEQHHEGVEIDIAGLEAAQTAREFPRQPGHAVGPAAVDDLHVADLPEQVADRPGAAHEDEVVDLVEVPLVIEEGVDHPTAIRHPARHALLEDIEPEGGEGPDQRQHQRRPLHPDRDIVTVVQDMVRLGHEDRAAPEVVLVVTDEPGREDEARGDGADRQKQQRNQHDPRALVRLQRAVVGVIVVRMIVVSQRLGMGFQLGVRGVVVMRVIIVMRVLPHRLVVEGHEHQTP